MARVTGLALMTDQAVAAVLSPALLLWEAETILGGRKVGRYLDMAAREWNLVFKENINSRLTGEYVQRIFNFLQGQHQTLTKLADQKTSSNFWYQLNRSELCDRFFGRFSIKKTLDGRENKYFMELWPGSSLGSPFSTHKKTPNKSPFVKSACINNNNTSQSLRPLSPPSVEHSGTSGSGSVNHIKQVFGPTQEDFESESEILPLHGFQIGSYSIWGQGKKPVCRMGKGFILLSWAPNHRLYLTAKDLDAAILSPETSPSPPLFLFLSPAGCLQIMKISQTVKQIPHTAFSSKSPSNQKKIVVNIKDMTPEVRESLRKSLDKSMGLRYVEVISTFGKLLSFGIVDYERAFTDPGVRALPMKILNQDDDSCSSSNGSGFLSRSGHDEGEGSDSGNSGFQDCLGNRGSDSDDDDYSMTRERIVNKQMVTSILKELASDIEENAENRYLVDTIVDHLIDEVVVRSTMKKRKHSPASPSTNTKLDKASRPVLKKAVNKDFDALKEGETFEVWLYVNRRDMRIDLKIAKNPETFLEVNLRYLTGQHPNLSKYHGKILNKSWKMLNKDPKAMSYDLTHKWPELYDYNGEPVAKKPKITATQVSGSPTSYPTNNNLDPSSPRCNSPQISKVKKDKVNIGRNLVEVKDVIDLTKSKSNSGCCDDCRYVTKMHKVRMLTGKYKCKCHPCVLRQQAISLGRTDPYKVIKISEFKGPGDYWSQPWLVDLYEDILKGCSGLTQEKIFEMTGSNEIMNKARIYERKKREQEYTAMQLD